MACCPTPPLFDVPARGNPLEFRDDSYPANTRGMWLPYGENFLLQPFFYGTPVFCDGWTDGRAITYSVLGIMLYAVAR